MFPQISIRVLWMSPLKMGRIRGCTNAKHCCVQFLQWVSFGFRNESSPQLLHYLPPLFFCHSDLSKLFFSNTSPRKHEQVLAGNWKTFVGTADTRQPANRHSLGLPTNRIKDTWYFTRLTDTSFLKNKLSTTSYFTTPPTCDLFQRHNICWLGTR